MLKEITPRRDISMREVEAANKAYLNTVLQVALDILGDGGHTRSLIAARCIVDETQEVREGAFLRDYLLYATRMGHALTELVVMCLRKNVQPKLRTTCQLPCHIQDWRFLLPKLPPIDQIGGWAYTKNGSLCYSKDRRLHITIPASAIGLSGEEVRRVFPPEDV